jgi:hypothetical protein
MNFDLLVKRWRWVMAATMIVDLAITLHGQPLSYWSDPLTAFEPNQLVRAVMTRGWCMFLAVAIAYIAALVSVVSLLRRKAGFVTLLVFVLAHFYAGSTWLDIRWNLGMSGPILYGIALSFAMTLAIKETSQDKEEKFGRTRR